MAALLRRSMAMFTAVVGKRITRHNIIRQQIHTKQAVFKGALLNVHFKNMCSNTQLGCWKCGAKVPERTVWCSKCDSPQQSLGKLNYFEVLQVPTEYDLDASRLRTAFRKLQSRLHPDKFATRSEEEKTISDQLSALVNQAYQTLSKHESRAVYLLQLKGKNIDELQLDGEFLESMMELNEKLAEDISDDLAREMLQEMNSEAESLIKEMILNFRNGDLDRACLCTGKLRYIENIRTKLKDILDEVN